MADIMDEELIATDEEMGAAGEAPPLAEEPVETETTGTIMTHTIEEIPELEGLTIGDELSFRVSNITEDGTFELEVIGPEMTPEEPGAGEAGLTEALI